MRTNPKEFTGSLDVLTNNFYVLLEKGEFDKAILTLSDIAETSHELLDRCLDDLKEAARRKS